MADLITIKSGALGDRETMPILSVNELGYRTDEKALYIGTANGNERLCGVNDVAEKNAKIAELQGRIDAITARLDAMTTTTSE